MSLDLVDLIAIGATATPFFFLVLSIERKITKIVTKMDLCKKCPQN
jgi:hypothetical protein